MNKHKEIHKNIRKRYLEKRKNKKKYSKKLIIGIGLVTTLFIACTTYFTVRAYNQPVSITLKLNNAEITQGEELPAFKASAVYHGKYPNKVLDKKKDFTVKDLVNELNAGENFTLSHSADPAVDNTYPVKIVLNKDFKTKLREKWSTKVNLSVQDGSLVVKNRLGAWSGTKFKLNSGDYLKNDFLSSMGNTYYFDENGEMVTGDKQIGLRLCTFSKEGVLLSKGEAAVQPEKPMIALTFDDGPGERTEELLGILEKYNAHATFFMQGMNTGKYPEALRKMLETGSELGNHSYNHPDFTKLKADEIKKQVNSTNTNIESICGQKATLMRPPYGAINDTLRANAGMPMILWSVDTLDWKTKDAGATLDSILSNSKDGAVILLHDIHSYSVDAAILAIPELTRRGYQLVTISEMAAAKGAALSNGKAYGSF